MGIIYCSNCEGKCSEALDICPHCGHPISEKGCYLVLQQKFAPLQTQAQSPQPIQIQQPLQAPPPAAPQHVTNVQVNVASQPKTKSDSSLGSAAIAFGIIACLGCWIPFLNVISIIIAGFGIFFGVIGFILSLFGGRVAKPVAGLFISGFAMFIAFTVTSTAAKVMVDQPQRINLESESIQPGTLKSELPDQKTAEPVLVQPEKPTAPAEKTPAPVTESYQPTQNHKTPTTLKDVNSLSAEIQSLRNANKELVQFDELKSRIRRNEAKADTDEKAAKVLHEDQLKILSLRQFSDEEIQAYKNKLAELQNQLKAARQEQRNLQ